MVLTSIGLFVVCNDAGQILEFFSHLRKRLSWVEAEGELPQLLITHIKPSPHLELLSRLSTLLKIMAVL